MQDWIPTVVIEAGSRMKPGKPRGPVPKTDFTVPPIQVPFDEAVQRYLRAKPPKGRR